jgi:putative membrane protein
MDEGFAKAVEDEVARIERGTDAEIVVVSASQSGQYRDVAMAGAALLTLLLVIGALVVPYTMHPSTLVVLMVLAFPALGWLLHSPWFLGRASGASRRAQQVREAAESEFVREAVHGTPNRSGVLVYRSALERRVEVIVDFGVQGRAPKGELDLAISAFGADKDRFLAGLRALGELLARRVPATEHSQAFDLHNAPRIRP